MNINEIFHGLDENGVLYLWNKIKALMPTKTSQLNNDSGFLTSHQDISGKLDKTGDGKDVTVSFTQASSRANIATGEKLSTVLGKIAKYLADMKSVAFSGSYNDLSNKPTIPTDNADLDNGAGYQTADQVNTAITNKGYQTAAQVESTVTGKGYQTSAQVEAAITEKGYQTAEQVESTVTGKGYQTAAQVESAITGKGYQTSAQVQNTVNAAVASVFKPKGTIAFGSLPTPAAGNVGWVYNVSDAFTTTAAFLEGAGKSFPAGTNVAVVENGGKYYWDVFPGFIDLSGYVELDNIVAITNAEIDAICV